MLPGLDISRPIFFFRGKCARQYATSVYSGGCAIPRSGMLEEKNPPHLSAYQSAVIYSRLAPFLLTSSFSPSQLSALLFACGSYSQPKTLIRPQFFLLRKPPSPCGCQILRVCSVPPLETPQAFTPNKMLTFFQSLGWDSALEVCLTPMGEEKGEFPSPHGLIHNDTQASSSSFSA